MQIANLFIDSKHQVRVHSAEGLSCPILGDHKYSHSDTLRPQLLSKYILDRLKIPQTKTRYIPMHLHLRKILIPCEFLHH